MLLYKLQSVLVYAFLWGSIYLLISLGFSLICGVLRIFHLGYGVTFVLAAYGTWAFMNELHLGLGPAIGLMLVVQIAFSLLIFYKGIFQRYLEQEEILLTLSMLIFLGRHAPGQLPLPGHSRCLHPDHDHRRHFQDRQGAHFLPDAIRGIIRNLRDFSFCVDVPQDPRWTDHSRNESGHPGIPSHGGGCG